MARTISYIPVGSGHIHHGMIATGDHFYFYSLRGQLPTANVMVSERSDWRKGLTGQVIRRCRSPQSACSADSSPFSKGEPWVRRSWDLPVGNGSIRSSPRNGQIAVKGLPGSCGNGRGDAGMGHWDAKSCRETFVSRQRERYDHCLTVSERPAARPTSPCISLGMISLVALPSATLPMASMAFSLITWSLGAFSFSSSRESARAF